MVCEKLETRKPGLITAFEALLLHLPPPYTCFREWAQEHDRSREVIRFGMIDCRARGTTSYERFLEKLAEIKQSLPKRQKHYGPSPEVDQFSGGEMLSPRGKAI